MKLTDDNPYDVLGISRDADKRTIRMAAFGRKHGKNAGRGSARRRARRAYDILRLPESRAIVDAFTPSFWEEANSFEPKELMSAPESGPPDWLDHLDTATIHTQAMRALVEATVHYMFREVPEPRHDVELSRELDGLEGFLENWLR